jgi:putative ribosome biogenesis GTPase RsgA
MDKIQLVYQAAIVFNVKEPDFRPALLKRKLWVYNYG